MHNLRLKPHSKPIPGVVPPDSYLKKYVQTDGETDHWFWQSTRRNHGHEFHGQAYVDWKVKPTHKTLFESQGRYNVARLLLEHLGSPLLTSMYSTCGLPQCIRPEHWKHVAKASFLQLVRLGDYSSLLDTRTGKTLKKTRIVNIQGYDGLVHRVSVAPMSLAVALCGASTIPDAVMVSTNLVTCTKGCQ